MIKELTEYYEPKNIIHREKQIDKIRGVFQTFKTNGMALNILIQGVTGSGKTTVIQRIVQEENNNLFASGSATKTAFKTLKALFDLKCNTIDRLLTDAINKLKRDPKILIIDELNQIRDTSNLFDYLNTIYRATNCPIIIISNKRTIIDEMPEDARLTLFFDKVDFPAYNAPELFDILKDRLEAIETPLPTIPEGHLRKICAWGGREGSARVVLLITFKCILANDFSEEYIDGVRSSLEKADWEDFVKSLIPTEREFLRGLIDLGSEKRMLKSADLLKMMKKYTPARISQLINSFEDYGIIKSEHKNLGRGGGRMRLVTFVSDEIYAKLEGLVGYG